MSSRNVPLDRLNDAWSDECGLERDEAERRLAQYGPNDILESPPNRWWHLMLETAKDPMLWFFAGTSALYAFVGQHTEAMTLLIAILPLLGMDIYLHRRTQASTAGLASRLATTATVLRNGVAVKVPSRELVPGDLVLARQGDPLPADGVIIAGEEMQVDESALTGEAYPVIKRPISQTPSSGSEPRIDEAHWAFAGTRMLTGSARLRVVFTGKETVYGEIVRSAVHGAHESTPLQQAIGRLVKVLLVAAIAVCLLLAGIRLYQGNSWLDALISAVTLATAAIPEEFPVVFTFFLGVGVYRLAQRQALVRRAVTVENIGRVTCICSDKTGTITEGQLVLAHLIPAPANNEDRLLSLACWASRADSGDPMDEAIYRRTPEGAQRADFERLVTFPFTEDRKRETAVTRDCSGQTTVVSKGAAEVILGMCPLTADEKARWLAQLEELAASAHKVIAVASRPTDAIESFAQEPDEGFVFAGLLAFEDPVRRGVPEAVASCLSAGIRPIMVTGDHPLTARAVAQEVGIGGDHPRVVLGDEIENLAKSGNSDLASVDVVARAKPAQKLMLVKALQEAGEIVAVTGDGVNDVPALQAADIGVAMGERGTRSAREVASIVLLDDNFRTIVGAIAEGRQLFQNLQLSFQYLLIIHIPLVLTATLIPLAGFPLLYLPVHIVWIEILIHPTAMLVFQETAAKKLVRKNHVSGKATFFNATQWTMLLLTGLVIAGTVSAGFLRSLEGADNVEHGRAMALATFTAASAAITAVLSRLRTRAAWIMCLGTVLSSFILIQTPGLDTLLHLSPLHWDDWALVLVASGCAAAVPLGFAAWNKGSFDKWRSG
ncbi:MAG: cation-transporting P-type ATPase [Pirellulales bacterium]|nr:cation-transporting P-type ATPase [Pirellulales bacterium]